MYLKAYKICFHRKRVCVCACACACACVCVCIVYEWLIGHSVVIIDEHFSICHSFHLVITERSNALRQEIQVLSNFIFTFNKILQQIYMHFSNTTENTCYFNI